MKKKKLSKNLPILQREQIIDIVKSLYSDETNVIDHNYVKKLFPNLGQGQIHRIREILLAVSMLIIDVQHEYNFLTDKYTLEMRHDDLVYEFGKKTTVDLTDFELAWDIALDIFNKNGYIDGVSRLLSENI